MNNSTIREQLIFKAGLQLFLVIGSVVFTFLYTMPQINASSERTQKTNEVIKNYESILDHGIQFKDLEKAIKATQNNNELLEVIQKNPEESQIVIKKTGFGPYLTWLRTALENSDQDKKKLEDAKIKINSIIPTLSPISGNISEKNITLEGYVRFIEQKILKDFSIKSFSPISIDGVKYEEKNGVILSPIGSFVLNLDIGTSNTNITQLLNFLQETGRPTILQDEGILTDAPETMSNPLIKVHSLSLQSVPNPQYPSLANTGSISLEFFVRGSSKNDGQYLLDTFNKKNTALGKQINEALERCKQITTACISLNAYESLQRKYQEFNQTIPDIKPEKGGNLVKIVYILGEQLQVLQALQNEFDNIK